MEIHRSPVDSPKKSSNTERVPMPWCLNESCNISPVLPSKLSCYTTTPAAHSGAVFITSPLWRESIGCIGGWAVTLQHLWHIMALSSLLWWESMGCLGGRSVPLQHLWHTVALSSLLALSEGNPSDVWRVEPWHYNTCGTQWTGIACVWVTASELLWKFVDAITLILSMTRTDFGKHLLVHR